MRGEYIKGLRERRKRSFWKILIPFVIFIVLATVLAVRFRPGPSSVAGLTLDDVKRLAGKGDALTWEDFEGYENEDVGSGIFVYRYPIDGRYDLLIGSPQERGEIMYIYLRDLDTGASIDIRTEDTEAFLRGDPSANAPAAPLSELRSAVAYVNWTQGEMIPGCLNMDKMMISSVRHLPVYKLDTKEDLDRFKANYGDKLTLDHGYNEAPSFNEVVSSYDESFFAGHTVILAYVSASSGSFRYAPKGVCADGSALCLDVIQTNDPEGYTADMAGWFVMAELSDTDVAGYSEFDARLVGKE
ncbi:MAG: hypothetical protein K6G90_03510 [Clostridia bacterium]|nr:hypothetical protein [Clostridia bacterium]